MFDLRIVVVGAGGLGTPIAWHLLENQPCDVSFSILILDNDKIERSNLNRQILFTEKDLGASKALTLTARLKEKYPSAEIIGLDENLDQSNISELLESANAVVDATDSPQTTFMLNDYCVREFIPFSYGGVLGLAGQSLLIAPSPGRKFYCLRCIFGDLNQDDIAAISQSCQSAGILGAVAGMVGLLQSQSVLDYFFGDESQRLEALKLKRFRFPELQIRCSETSPSRECPLGCAKRKALSLNLVEKKCPQTFILSKLAMEQISLNQCIEASFGNLDSFHNVITSLQHEGITARLSSISDEVWKLNLALTKGGQ